MEMKLVVITHLGAFWSIRAPHLEKNNIPDDECIQNLVTLSTQTFLRVPECFSNRVASRIIRLTVT